MALTEQKINAIKPQAKDTWYSDEKGLRLLVKANGSKYWRLAYRFGGKQKTLSLGVYPNVSLKDARLKRDKARIDIAEHRDPGQTRKNEKHRTKMVDAKLFSSLAKAWWEHSKGIWTEEHAKRVWTRLSKNTFEYLDVKPVEEIVPKDVRDVVRRIEARGTLDVAERVLQDIKRVFSHGVYEEWIKFNPAGELKQKNVVMPHKVSHRPSMKNDELGLFLSELDHYGKRGRLLTKYAITMQVYTFVRPGELRGAEWVEFDRENSIWRIPGKRMKMKTDHLVPLSNQILTLLDHIKKISGQYRLLFPSERCRLRPMSDNTMRRAIFKLGYDGNNHDKSKAVPHGFRANAASILNEHGFNADAIERQLSHMERNDVRAAYTYHAEYLDQRKKMMQWWADHLDEKKAKVLMERKH